MKKVVLFIAVLVGVSVVQGYEVKAEQDDPLSIGCHGQAKPDGECPANSKIRSSCRCGDDSQGDCKSLGAWFCVKTGTGEVILGSGGACNGNCTAHFSLAGGELEF